MGKIEVVSDGLYLYILVFCVWCGVKDVLCVIFCGQLLLVLFDKFQKLIYLGVQLWYFIRVDCCDELIMVCYGVVFYVVKYEIIYGNMVFFG